MIHTVVVDDDFRVARIHTTYVERVAGFDVIAQAHTAAEAMDCVRRLRPDLMLLDLYLPDENGLDLAARLHAMDDPAVDLIVITAATDVDSVRIALQRGAVHYLIKPFTFATLRERLLSYAAMRAQLAGQRTVDQRHVDRALQTLRTTEPFDQHKGWSAQTSASVERLLAETPQGVTASFTAEVTGMSRATAQRYLSHLAETGRATIDLRYGAAGRPEHIYRSLTSGSGRG